MAYTFEIGSCLARPDLLLINFVNFANGHRLFRLVTLDRQVVHVDHVLFAASQLLSISAECHGYYLHLFAAIFFEEEFYVV